MPRIDERAAFDQFRQMARMNFERDGFIAPVFLVGSPERPALVQPDFSSNEGKQVTVKAIKQLADKTKAGFVILVAEAWVTVVAGMDGYDGTPPSKNPARKEIVQVTLMRRDGQHESAYALIDRTSETPTLGEWVTDATCLSGAFADGIFPQVLN